MGKELKEKGEGGTYRLFSGTRALNFWMFPGSGVRITQPAGFVQ